MLILLACSPAPGGPAATTASSPLSIESTAQPTVFFATVDAPDADGVSVRWDETHVTEAVAYTDGTWQATLFLPAGETVDVDAVITTGDDEELTDAEAIEVDAPTSSLPGLTITGADDTDAVYLLTWPGKRPGLVSIVNREGQTLWWHESDHQDIVMQARRTNDGRSLVWQNTEDVYGLTRVDLATGDETFIEVPESHHDFCELPSGEFLVIVTDRRVQDGISVIGDAIVKVSADGTEQEQIWTAWDTFPFEWDAVPLGESTIDWTHANAVTYDAYNNKAIVSLHNLNTVFELDPNTGTVGWRMGGSDGNLILTGGEPFYGQHGAIRTPSGVLLFNNRDTLKDQADLWSEAVEYKIDFTTHSYERIWSYDAGKTLFAPVLGNAEPLADGGTMIGWGTAGRLNEIDPLGNVTWQLDTELGGALGYVHRYEAVLGG